jgi:hypothetical protein
MDDNPPDRGKRPTHKQQLQATLDSIGVPFLKSDTIATLERLVNVANGASTSTSSQASSKSLSKKETLQAQLRAQGVAFDPKAKVCELDRLVKAVTSTAVPAKEPTRLQKMLNALRLLKVTPPRRAKVGELEDLCVMHGITGFEPKYQEATKKTVVKCALRKAMNLDAEQYDKFGDKVDELVNIVSRMFRRASVALALYVLRKLESDGGIPNMPKEKDTYWKRWLMVGLDPKGVEDGYVHAKLAVDGNGRVRVSTTVAQGQYPEASTLPTVRVRIVAPQGVRVRLASQEEDGLVTVNLAVEHVDPITIRLSFQDDDSACVAKCFDAIKNHLGPVIDPRGDGSEYARGLPSVYFDQVLNYAGHTLATVVWNNQWVPFVPRLVRLCKKTLQHVQRSTRLGTSLTNYKLVAAVRSGKVDGLPRPLEAFAVDVRRRLGVFDGRFIGDEHLKRLGFSAALGFNAWMQRRFIVLGTRHMKMMPVFRVRRAFVRLDKKTLVSMVRSALPHLPEVAALDTMERAGREDKSNGGHGLKNPAKIASLASEAPKRTKESFGGNQRAWKVYTAKANATAKEATSSAAYVAQAARYGDYKRLKKRVIKGLFRELPKKKAPWEFDGSVMTDGVSLCISFSKTVQVRVAPKATAKVTDGVARSSSSEAEQEPALEWDRAMSTSVGDALYLGLDPGRSNICDISYIHDDGVKRTKGHFCLTRGQYYAESGTQHQNRLKSKRWASLDSVWSDMRVQGGSLRAIAGEEIITYAKAYAEISREWWQLAMARRESRADLQRYIGKRRVIDKFFANVDKIVKRRFPEVTAEIAYGSAVTSMKATGLGEIAAPVGGAFKACRRVFGDRLCVISEYKSTKTAWETGKDKHLVFRAPVINAGGEVTWRLDHAAGKHAPTVLDPSHVQHVRRLYKAQTAKGKSRRGGTVEIDKNDNDDDEDNGRALRYPEVRGLRFCPERRIFLDRDRAASLTIARLRCQEKLSLRRPLAFCTTRAQHAEENEAPAG